MHTFKNETGKEFTVSLDINAVRTIRDRLGVDIVNFASEEQLQKLFGDVVMFVDVLYLICEPQCEAAGLTDEQFGAGLGGDNLGDAIIALEGAIVSFIPSPKQRANMQSLLKAARDTDDAAQDLIQAEIAKLNPAKEAAKLIETAGSGSQK